MDEERMGELTGKAVGGSIHEWMAAREELKEQGREGFLFALAMAQNRHERTGESLEFLMDGIAPWAWTPEKSE